MKRYRFLRPGSYLPACIFLTASIMICGRSQAQTSQTQTNWDVKTAQIKSQAQTLTPYNTNTGGNFASTAVVNRVSTPLSLTAGQSKSMNTAIYNFLNSKGALNKLKWSNPSAYRQQLAGLIQQLAENLSAFLSTDQVNQFVAMKPASARTRDPLVMIFY